MADYFGGILDSLIPALIFWGILAFSVHRNRSRYRNCTFLMLALLWTMPVIASFGGKYYGQVMLVLVIALLVVIMLVPAILIANGVLMMKREGHSFQNMLSLFLGIVVGVGELATIGFVLMIAAGIKYDISYEGFIGSVPAILLFISWSVIYVSLSFVAFVFYTKFLEIIPIKRDFDYVIVLGAGLLHGDQVSKLLADRLDKAIEIYRKDPTPPYIIPSGGQGGNETIPEAAAMKKYLLEKGIPEEHIIPEDRSKTTRENLVNSKAIMDARDGRKYLAVVTSNYHVYRALRLCRKLNLEAVGVGGHVAPYYWPSALIREYVAVHSEKKHLIIFIVGWLIVVALPLWLMIG